MNSPWGQVDSVENVCRGICWVSTPSHGGLRVSRNLAEKRLSDAALVVAEEDKNYYYFEEDCDCYIVINELFDLFKDKINIDDVKRAIEKWRPKYLENLNNNFKRESREIGTKLKLQNNIKFSIFEFPIGTECQIVGFDGKGYHVSFSGRLVRISFRMFNYFFQP